MPQSWSPCRALVVGAFYGVASTPALELHRGCGRRPRHPLQGAGMTRCHQGMPWSMFALQAWVPEQQSSTGALLLSGTTRSICSNSGGSTR